MEQRPISHHELKVDPPSIMALLAECSSEELLQAQLQLWHQALSFSKPVALSIVLELRIPDAIHRLGGAATLPQIMAEAGIHPCKLRDLRRIMRVVTLSGIFTKAGSDGGRSPIYKQTTASRLLLRDESLTTTQQQVPYFLYMQLILQPCQEAPVARGLLAWFQQDQPPPAGQSPFALAYSGKNIWERAEHDATVFPFDDAMASDTAFLMPIVLKECGGELFHGLASLVDVAGGLGGAAVTIKAAFPDLKCTVLDLPQVVAKAPTDNGVQYVAGDIFECIPPTNAVFLKWILHDWNDDECIKILKNCKEAISPRDEGGKVIIIDMVVGSEASDDTKHVETQVLYDIFLMTVNGVERDEEEWKKIFFEAGFKDYKIIPLLGVRSIIELYP